jgi:hypothetical protein
MKVAINVAHGSFGLSPEAIKLYFKKVGKPCYFFELSYKSKEEKYEMTYTPTDTPTGALRWTVFTIPDPSANLKEAYKHHFTDSFRDDRANKFLVETIEELGSKAASGPFAKLKIVEVPDDVKWHIAEFDGWEWVAENHRTWE